MSHRPTPAEGTVVRYREDGTYGRITAAGPHPNTVYVKWDDEDPESDSRVVPYNLAELDLPVDVVPAATPTRVPPEQPLSPPPSAEVRTAELEAATVRAAAWYRRAHTARTWLSVLALIVYGTGVFYAVGYRDDYQLGYACVTWGVFIYAIGDVAVTATRRRFTRALARRFT